MKRTYIGFILFFSIVLFTGCNSQTQIESSDSSNINQQVMITPTSIPVRKSHVRVNTRNLKIPRTE